MLAFEDEAVARILAPHDRERCRSGGAWLRTGWPTAGAPSRSPAVSGRRASRWRAGRTCRHVRADRKAGGRLYLLLRRRGKRPNWKGGRHAGRGHIPGRVDITERPAVAEAKERVGDREADTIIGKGRSGALVSLVDRASKCTLLALVGRKTADAVGNAMLGMLLPLYALVHTITADNGKEFAGHAQVAQALGAGFFFATPYHSWERGLNEHTNGLVRQYFPKWTDFRQITDAQVKAVQDRTDARPRKALGCLTPEEAFRKARPP